MRPTAGYPDLESSLLLKLKIFERCFFLVNGDGVEYAYSR